MTQVFIVRVEGNLVNAIERREARPADRIPGTPLEVGTQLATAFRESGRIDGLYLFAEREGARSFASLCLQFMKALVEQRSRHIEALPAGFESYCEQQARGPASG